MKFPLSAMAWVFLTAWSASAEAPPVVTALRGLDPVALVDGKEIEGSTEMAVVRGRYRYLFANGTNKKRFEKAPESHAVQMDGACARMGPLSGAGSADRFQVHDRRIYLFASEACRNAFKTAPERFIDREDALPAGSPEAHQQGQILLGRVLTGLGGAEKVDGLATFQASLTVAYKQGDQVSKGIRIVTLAFPGRYREEETWGASRYGHGLGADGAFQFNSRHAWTTDRSVRAYLERELLHQPLVVLKARTESGFQAVAAGSGKVGEANVDFLTVGIKGAATTLAIDRQTGRILEAAYRGRAGGAVGDVVKVYTDFRSVNDLVLPFQVRTRFNGKDLTNPEITLDSVQLNIKLEEGLFRLAK